MTALRLAKRKELWVPTLLGWVLIVLTVFALITIYVRNIHSFLSVSKPVRTQILAVEEWISPRAIEGAGSEYINHDYIILVVIGDEKRWVIPILEKSGVNKKRIVQIPVPTPQKDRTFASAVALDNWLKSSGMYGKAVNIYSSGTHGRRSWMLFREALGTDYPLGVISFQSPGYDPKRWWKSSEGFRSVIYETIAYAYTEFFFLPVKALE